MTSRLLITGGIEGLEPILQSAASDTKSSALALATAYVSVYGARAISRLKRSLRLKSIRLVADTRDAVSHPQALRDALNDGWRVRVVSGVSTFHPKLYVGGDDFGRDGSIVGSKFYIVGSNNLTRGGLCGNTECSFVRESEKEITAASAIFRQLWKLGEDLDHERLEAYEEYFARRNRKRTADDLLALGVAEQPYERKARSNNETMTVRAARTAWVGLESSTGEYRFQVEFPRLAGEVLRRMVGDQAGPNLPVFSEDGAHHQMTYRFYADNSMFRLNVPNEISGVSEARQRRSGVALMEKLKDGSLRLRIMHDLQEIDDIEKRSEALGTLYKTSTRFYGWY